MGGKSPDGSAVAAAPVKRSLIQLTASPVLCEVAGRLVAVHGIKNVLRVGGRSFWCHRRIGTSVQHQSGDPGS